MRKVLIVDDDQLSIALYKELLPGSVYDVLSAKSGEEALEIAKADLPHLVVMDWILPKMDGLETAKIIKDEIKEHFIFMMMITGQRGNEAKVQSLEYFDDYMEKPLHPDVFVAKVNRAFKTINAFNELSLLYHQKRQLLTEKENLINQLQKERESLEQKVYLRTVELDQKNKILSERNEEILRDMEIASRLQNNLLPQHSPSYDRYKIYSQYHPMDHIGGDFFDFLEMRENKIGILLGDVSGHGIAAAFITSMVKNIVAANRFLLPNPKDFFKNLNEELLEKIYYHFVTAAYGVFDLEKSEMTFSSAGQVPPLFYKKETDEIIELKTEGTILGAVPNLEFNEQIIHLDSGDRILFFTDGIMEVFDCHKEQLGMERLKAAFRETKDLHGDEVFNHLIEVAKLHSDTGEFNDDVALVLVEVA